MTMALSLLLLSPLLQAAEPTGSPLIAPYDGPGAVVLEKSGFVKFIYGDLRANEMLNADVYKLPTLDQQFLFHPLDGDEIAAIGWLIITPNGDSAFDVLLSPSPQLGASGVDGSERWEFDPYDAQQDDPQAWLLKQVQDLAGARSFRRILHLTFTVTAGAADEGSSEVSASSKRGDAQRGVVQDPSDDVPEAAAAPCLGARCSCSIVGQCSCTVCCAIGRHPSCNCVNSNCRCTCEVLAPPVLDLDVIVMEVD